MTPKRPLVSIGLCRSEVWRFVYEVFSERRREEEEKNDGYRKRKKFQKWKTLRERERESVCVCVCVCSENIKREKFF